MNQHYDPRYEGMNINDYKNIILARWKLALAGFIVVFSGVAIFTFTTQPIYQAFSTIQVGTQKNAFRGSPLEQAANFDNPIDTEIQVLLSRTIAEEAARRLHLNWQVTKNGSDIKLKISEFASEQKNTPYRIELTGSETFKITDANNNQVGTGKAGVPLKGSGISLLFAELRGKAGDSFVLTALSLEAVATKILSATKVVQVGQNTNIIKISYLDPDPKLAAELVNSIVQVYLGMAVSLKSQESSKSLEFIDQQLMSMKEELDKAEKKLQAFKISSGVLNLDAEGTKVFTKITEADKQQTQLQLLKKQLEFAMASLKESMKNGKVYVPTDPIGSPAAGKLAELETQKKALLTSYTEAHPQVRAIQDQVDEVKRNLLSVYESNLKNLARQGTNLSPLLTGYEGELRKLPEKERELASLMRQTKVTSELYTFLLQRQQELRVTNAATVSNSSVIDPAVPAQNPIKPNKRKNILMGLLIACICGIGLPILLELLDDTIHDVELAKSLLGLPLLGIIPYIRIVGGMSDTNSNQPRDVVSMHDPKSPVSEAFRSLRTSIHFSAVQRKRQVMMITSTFPGEGKTTIMANLAVSFSQVGSRVILLDCDMRRPSQHSLFGLSKAPGLSELLAGDVELNDLIHTIDVAGLDFVSSGTTPPNPAELLGSNAMSNLIQSLRESYDTIVIDCPPVLAVTDASVLSTLCDMVLLVIESGRSPVKATKQMVDTLQNVGAPIAGFVMNDKKQNVNVRYKYYEEGSQSYHGADRKAENKNWLLRYLKK